MDADRFYIGKDCYKQHGGTRYKKGGECVECAKEKSVKQRLEKAESLREYKRKWKRNNKDLVNANTAKRRASKLNATPEWLNAGHTAELEGMYLYAQIFSQIGEQMHVDHLVPLQGKNVCGLHAPWNLQVISASENLKKSNKLIEE